jgi:hypothetical protein
VKLNFDQVSSDQGTFEPLPEGDYVATVFEVKLAKSKTSNNEYYNWTFQVQTPSRFRNRRLFHITTLAEQSLWNLKQTIEAVTGEPLVGDYDPSEHIREYLGRPVLLRVTQEEYQGTMRNRVKRVSPAPVAVAAGDASDEDDDTF